MLYPRMALQIFEGRSPADQARDARVLGYFLDALTLTNVDYLRRHPSTPALYRSGVRYWAPPDDGTDDDWCDIPTVLAAKRGDCDDLACWRAAELRVSGIQAVAQPLVYYSEMLSKKLGRPFFDCHILVQYPNGSREDPSKILGMK